jgi:hypothetical protein
VDNVAFIPTNDLRLIVVIEQEVRQGDLQCGRDPLQGLQRGVSFAMLELANKATSDLHAGC